MALFEKQRIAGTALCLAAALLAGPAGSARADQVIPDDLIVQSSLCVGIPCILNESFGFDTVRLKGEVLGIHFIDTSVGAFPTTDWAIVANDPDGSGLANRFSIQDLTAGTTPFSIAGGAPDGSLFIAADGAVGIGTATPQAGTALDVSGSLRVDGTITATGTTTGLSGVKAGIIPKSAFRRGRARVTFATPYAGDYLVMLTAISRSKLATFSPVVLRKDAASFTVGHGGSLFSRLVAVQWMTQPVGQ